MPAKPSSAGKIISALGKQGASEVRLIEIPAVVVDERVRLKCQVPLCDSYGRNLMCPPYVPSVAEFRVALEKFGQAILLLVSARLPERPVGPSANVFAPAKKLHDLVNKGEKMAFEKGFRFATGLIGGCCRLCDECEGTRPGGICRHPFKARPSMEAMGIDVMATLERAGLKTVFPVSDVVTWTGLLLL